MLTHIARKNEPIAAQFDEAAKWLCRHYGEPPTDTTICVILDTDRRNYFAYMNGRKRLTYDMLIGWLDRWNEYSELGELALRVDSDGARVCSVKD